MNFSISARYGDLPIAHLHSLEAVKIPLREHRALSRKYKLLRRGWQGIPWRFETHRPTLITFAADREEVNRGVALRTWNQ